MHEIANRLAMGSILTIMGRQDTHSLTHSLLLADGELYAQIVGGSFL